MKYDIVTIGDAFEDVLVLPQDLKVKEDRSFASGFGVSFELGEKIPLEDVDYEIGGSACNTSVGFSKLGLKASLISVIGDDSPSEKILSRLELEKVDTSHIIVNRKMKTNFSVIFRMDQGRTIFIYHGLRDYSVLRLKSNVSTRWIFLAPLGINTENIEKDVVAHISEKNSKLAWNPGAIQIKKGVSHYRNLLKNTSVLFLNKEEAVKFTNYPVRPVEEELLKKLHSFGADIVVITNGKHGAKAFDGERTYSVPAYDSVIRVDSTGAGDSFASGFLAKLLHSNLEGGKSNDSSMIEEALKWGIANSNSVVTQVGAQKGLLTVREIEAMLVKYCHPIITSRK